MTTVACPRCGHEMVHHHLDMTCFLPWCESCGFGDSEKRFGYWAHKLETFSKARADCSLHARRLVRAELARQAMEMRAHGQAWCTDVSATTPHVRGHGPYNLPSLAPEVQGEQGGEEGCGGAGMTTDTPAPALPEWPDMNDRKMTSLDFHARMSNAALARMEALMEYAEHSYECMDNIPGPCTCGLSALLAACERPGERREG